MDKKLLWWIFGVTKGGPVRAGIVQRLRQRPSNANQLAQDLRLDYKTVRYHLDILLKHGVLTTSTDTYVVMYFLSEAMEGMLSEFEEIYSRLKKS